MDGAAGEGSRVRAGRAGLHVCGFVEDYDGAWKRTVAGCMERLKRCESGMERERGTAMNLRWLHWAGEWDLAFEWLEKRAPRMAKRLIAEAEALHRPERGE